MDNRITCLIGVILAAVALCAAQQPYVGGYVLLSRVSRNGQIVGLSELAALADQAATIPVSRLWLSFFAPTMVYYPRSYTLEHSRLNVSNTGDFGFADILASVRKLQAAGIEVFLSMGGWNYNCFPYMYARYSVGGYGQSTPNYYKIQTYGNGSLDNCVPSNQFCYVCEPPSENTTISDFQIFPEPDHSPTWQQAAQYIQQHQNSSFPVQWNYDMKAGSKWTDPKTKITVIVPGDPFYIQVSRDPYQDLVYLAKDLGADGIDIDYEEFWHGDYFKVGNPEGPWGLPQTTYKYAAIVRDVMINVQAIYPTLKVSTAAGAVGAWSSPWWGGNLKGLWYNVKQWFPELIDFLSVGQNAGGINVMTYDLSDNPTYHECPDENDCPLDKQVAFYMKTYDEAGIKANVGYEIGVPAYPAPDHDKQHQLPLTNEMFQSISTQTQPSHSGAFFWELFKAPVTADNVSPTQLSQTLCRQLLNAPRCAGVIPNVTSVEDY